MLGTMRITEWQHFRPSPVTQNRWISMRVTDDNIVIHTPVYSALLCYTWLCGKQRQQEIHRIKKRHFFLRYIWVCVCLYAFMCVTIKSKWKYICIVAIVSPYSILLTQFFYLPSCCVYCFCFCDFLSVPISPYLSIFHL